MKTSNELPFASTYQATIPDTLDLAERARAAVNFLSEIMAYNEHFQPFQKSDYYRNPPVFSHEPGGTVFVNGNEMWGKAAEALLEMRLMSGSAQNGEIDEPMLDEMLRCIGADHLFYSSVKKVEGDHLIEAEDFADLVSGGRVMLALIARYQLDGQKKWLDGVARLAQGYQDVAIEKDDYAYYPDGHMGGAISRPRSGWKDDHEPSGASLYASRDWYECSSNVLFTYGGIIQGLCRWNRMSGDAAALELAAKLARFMLQPRFWQAEAAPGAVVGSEHAHFEGHLHATVRGLWGLLEYAVLANDEKIKQFVRDGYHYVRSFGIARIGLFGEGCTVGDMTCLAIKLTDAGLGDYWEDVDQVVRNHLTELQILEEGPVCQIAAASPKKAVGAWEDARAFSRRQIGALCDDATHPTLATPGTMHCCSYNGLIGYYHAWDGIVREANGIARVNLLLNRASPALDIDSYLPYEGKVVLRNKTARMILLRLPRWVDLAAVRCRRNGLEAPAVFLERSLLLEQVQLGERIEVDFPVVESVETYQCGWEGLQIPGWTEVTRPLEQDPTPRPFEYVVSAAQKRPAELTAFTCHFRGNTLIEIQPRESGWGYPLYLRQHLKQHQAPLVEVTRVVAPRRIDV